MSVPEIWQLAAEAGSYFTYSGDEPEGTMRPNIWTYKEDTPEWVQQLVYNAHDGLVEKLPDDWTYEVIVIALSRIEEVVITCEMEFEQLLYGLEPDVYTHDLLKWFGSLVSRHAYVDEYRDDWGPSSTIMGDIAAGQLEELQEIYSRVFYFLEDRQQELEVESDEEDEDDEEDEE